MSWAQPAVRSLGVRLLTRSCGGRRLKRRSTWGRTSVSTHPMAPHPGDLAMIITPEQAALKAQHQFDDLRDFVQKAAQEKQRIDAVERGLMRQWLALGHALLSAFIAQQGDGDLGPEAKTAGGQTARRLPERHGRRYVSIFGELTIHRAVYGTREGQRIERVPLDESLGLPEGDFSYVLEDWGQRLCLKGSFAEAGHSLERLLGRKLRPRPLEHMARRGADYAPAFQDSLPVPPPQEEGPLMVITADGKGVPMRRPPQDGPRPHHRRAKGEKANKKQMACVGAVYSIEPLLRRAEDIIDEVLRDEKAKKRPRPQHKHVWAEMTREIDGIEDTAKEGLFCQLYTELILRNLGHDRPVVCLLDGERALWDAREVYFPE